MTNPLSFDDLKAILHQCSAHLPDHRKPSPNTRYTMQDTALGAFGIFFTQSPSFLEYQRRLQASKGRNNAQTLFGVQKIPCDNQIRTLLDPIAPSHFDPIFLEVFQRLEQHHLCDSFRVLGDQLLVALDGTTYFSSQAIHCHNCLTRRLSNGQTLYYHSAITPVVVCPRRSQVIALPPEYIMPQDGHDKQDCEQMAGKRWIRQHAHAIAPHHVTLLGDDLYSKQPFCALALEQGFNFILVCKPDSHPKLYERVAFWQANDGIAACESRHWNGRFTEVSMYRFLNDVLLLDGKYSANPLPIQKKQHLSEKSGITSSMEHPGPQLISTFELAPVHSSGTTPFSQQPVVLTKQAYIELKWEANYWRAQHERLLDREAALQGEVAALQATIRDLN